MKKFNCLIIIFTFLSLAIIGNESIAPAFDISDLKGMFVANNIPAHPALDKKSEKSYIANGIKIKEEHYQAENISSANIASYYKDALTQRGFSLAGEDVNAGTVSLSFTDKDNNFVRINIIDAGSFKKPGSALVTVSYSEAGMDKLIQHYTESESLDTPGQDLEWLKRYPNAYRVSSTVEDNGRTNINYRLPNESCTNCAVSFYKEQMAGNGWVLENESYHGKDELSKDMELDMDKIRKMAEKIDYTKKTDFTKEQADEALDNLSEMSQKLKDYDFSIDEMVILRFKQDKKRCVISVSYKNFEKMYNHKDMQEAITALSAQAGASSDPQSARARQLMGLDDKEAIVITILYMPSPEAEKMGANTWF